MVTGGVFWGGADFGIHKKTGFQCQRWHTASPRFTYDNTYNMSIITIDFTDLDDFKQMNELISHCRLVLLVYMQHYCVSLWGLTSTCGCRWGLRPFCGSALGHDTGAFAWKLGGCRTRHWDGGIGGCIVLFCLVSIKQWYCSGYGHICGVADVSGGINFRYGGIPHHSKVFSGVARTFYVDQHTCQAEELHELKTLLSVYSAAKLHLTLATNGHRYKRMYGLRTAVITQI